MSTDKGTPKPEKNQAIPDDFDCEPDRPRLDAAYLDRVLPEHVKAALKKEQPKATE